MALSLDVFVEASKPKRVKCGLGEIIDSLTPKDREVLAAALTSTAVTHSAIAKVLTDAGHPIKQGTVNRHRAGKCSCGPR